MKYVQIPDKPVPDLGLVRVYFTCEGASPTNYFLLPNNTQHCIFSSPSDLASFLVCNSGGPALPSGLEPPETGAVLCTGLFSMYAFIFEGQE
jgi:hypothetical protein